ncbi:MAG TPA: hypothetical protein VKU39_13285 [Streptosporangiaceae bacterium]|nr:hypothetical protein [Streptosporangiaceae bacterium]
MLGHVPPKSRLIRSAGLRRPAGECFELGKDSFGLDQSQVRLYTANARHTPAGHGCPRDLRRHRNPAPRPCLASRAHPPRSAAATGPGLIALTVPEVKRRLAAIARTRPPGHAARWTRVIRSAVQAPQMNSIMERWISSCRRELLDRTLIWNQRHLIAVLRDYEDLCNSHRPQRTLNRAAPLRPLPDRVTDLDQFQIGRHDRAGGVIHEYRLVA